MQAALRTVRLIHIAMLASIGMYVVIGETVRSHYAAHPTVLYALSFASISVVGALLVVRRTLVVQSELQLREKPEDAALLSRWRAGHIITYALCETLALFGLVLRLLSFTISQTWPYYAGGFVLMLLFWPREPRVEG